MIAVCNLMLEGLCYIALSSLLFSCHSSFSVIMSSVSSDKSFVDSFSDSSVVLCFRIRIKNQLFYLVITHATWTFRHGTCSKTTELFKSKDHKAPVLCVFIAAGSDMLRNVLHIKQIHFQCAQIEDVLPCRLQLSH
jgi:hypothetical protein